MTRARLGAALILIIVLGLTLRLYHVRSPILDHPGWRQGDESAIARNFATLQNNIFYPQTDYDGPPPNYVELELQIVPYLAAQLYRIFGVHEIFLRLIVIAFSLATIPLLFALGAELYSRRAGLIAALLFAITPGAVYYGRAILPESDMIFFGFGALLFWWRWCARRRAGDFALATLFAALAWLAKPPALLLLAPMLAVSVARSRARVFSDWSPYVLLAASLLPLAAYLHHVSAIAEWHWASGITLKHVLPTLRLELARPAALLVGLQATLALAKMLSTTILGPVLFGLTLLASFTQPPLFSSTVNADGTAREAEHGRFRACFFGAWFAALCLYAFVVVNVERVDYYLMPFVPFAALYASGALDHLLSLLAPRTSRSFGGYAAMAAALFLTCYAGMLAVHPYYTWSRPVYSAATELRSRLAPGSLIVMGHYDPSVLYTIGRRGWEEDPLLWNVHDMTSAINKGARYFVALEVPRFRANKQLYAFMQRYRRVPVRSGWQVYDFRHFAHKEPANAATGANASAPR
ncbi:MAG: ArnT family glycosyltransferase [Candidatus Eremiobacter antarcticus]|nr:glycosyltransferase family 39 protein [Candidatus Eremiobacteraeota bacterium]MBC5808911.1 glycosyltransferase family 39 protein [Candidatus Eremiobacteraeota bacterium]